MNKIDFQLKQKIFKRDNFQCQKCGFIDKSCQELELHHITPLVFGLHGGKFLIYFKRPPNSLREYAGFWFIELQKREKK